MPKHAVVLGGGSEMGQGILSELVKRGLESVFLVGPNPASLQRTATTLEPSGVEVYQRVMDLTDTNGIAAMATEAMQCLGDLDLVLVAAGRLGTGDLDVLDPEAVARLVAVNFAGPAAAMFALAKVMMTQGHGRIVVISSAAAQRLGRWTFLYGSTKSGLDAFGRGLALAVKGSGVSVIILRPGFVRTRMTRGGTPTSIPVDPIDVARALVRGWQRGAEVIWIPTYLGPSVWLLRVLPARLRWRPVI